MGAGAERGVLRQTADRGRQRGRGRVETMVGSTCLQDADCCSLCIHCNFYHATAM